MCTLEHYAFISFGYDLIILLNRQEAAGALWNLSFDDRNREAIAAAGGVQALVCYPPCSAEILYCCESMHPLVLLLAMMLPFILIGILLVWAPSTCFLDEVRLSSLFSNSWN